MLRIFILRYNPAITLKDPKILKVWDCPLSYSLIDIIVYTQEIHYVDMKSGIISLIPLTLHLITTQK